VVFAPGAVAEDVYKHTNPSGKPAAGLSKADKKLLEQANERAAKLDRATDDIVTAHNALRAAQARREEGVEPLEGERSGRRYRQAYWERQQALSRDVEEAKARLDDALAQRNALR
jgi:peptidoglycan hydrolase CwlO-like protein